MAKVNTRDLVVEILLLVTRDGQYSHIALNQVLEKYQYLDKSDRAFITRVTEGTLERMIELALEGQRFWDLRRWNLAVEYLNKPMRSWDIEQEKTEDYYKLRTYYIRDFLKRDNLWPLKTNDLIVNPNLKQNTIFCHTTQTFIKPWLIIPMNV